MVLGNRDTLRVFRNGNGTIYPQFTITRVASEFRCVAREELKVKRETPSETSRGFVNGIVSFIHENIFVSLNGPISIDYDACEGARRPGGWFVASLR